MESCPTTHVTETSFLHALESSEHFGTIYIFDHFSIKCFARYQTLDSTLSEDFLFSSCNVPNVIKCLNKLKLEKCGSPENSNSNHFYMHQPRLYVVFSIIHGYTPNDLLASVIISVPEDNKGNLRDSNNYRRISLCSASCKAVDLFILVTCGDKLTSSDYQYAFKRKSSTVICT